MTWDAGCEVCVVGSLNADVTLRVPRLPAAGETTLATSRLHAPGGKGANQAAAAAAYGSRVAFVGAVGDDHEGEAAVRNLRERGIDTTAIARVPHSETGAAVIYVAEDGENMIVVHPGANAVLDPHAAAEGVRGTGARVVLAQLEVPIRALEAAAAAAAAGTTVVLNPAPMVRRPDDLDRLLQQVTVLVPNRRELGQLAGRAEPRTLSDVDGCVADLGFPGVLVVTLGADGAMVYRPSSDRPRVHVPAEREPTVDTSGAGDAFCGALASELASGADVETAVRAAVRFAGRSTRFHGAQVPRDMPADA